jgi:Ca2+/Na+ antiporter
MAILSYERAFLLIPRDQDLKINYEIANNKIKQKSSSLFVRKNVTLNKMYYQILAMFLFFIFCFSFSFFKSKIQFIFSIFTLMIFIVLVMNVFVFLKKKKVENEVAIVISENSNLYESPLSDGKIILPLFEGNKVLVKKRISQWSKVSKDLKTGWVKRTDIKEIVY